jgi:cell division protein FtsB
MRGRTGLVFAALALAGVMALAVFPTKAWLDQRHYRRQLAARVTELSASNAALQDRADQLQTDAEIERLARQYNLVKPGEEAYFVLPRPEPPATQAPAAPPPPAHRSRSLWNRLTSIF